MAWTPSGVGVVGGMSPDDVRALVERTCAAQGIPVYASAPGVVAAVAALLGSGFSREGSGTPDRLDASGVETVGLSLRGVDHDVMDNRLDDGTLAVEVEGGPLAS